MNNPYAPKRSAYGPWPLNQFSEEFRLLELRPGRLSDPIKCSTRVYSLHSRLPEFTALSYTWGSVIASIDIELNDVPFAVGRNLWTFLEEMRSQKQYRMYWIDAICINQSNEYERSHQIPIMRRIYRRATSVSIWLGDFYDLSYLNRGMEFLIERTPNPFLIEQEAEFGTEPQAKGIIELCDKRYWRRVWIIQEVMLARQCTIWCGNMRTELGSLWALANQVRGWYQHFTGSRLRLPRTLLDSPAAIIVFAKAERDDRYQSVGGSGERQPACLMGLLETYRHQEATNVLDKVYALQGLAHDAEDIEIDYSISPEGLAMKLLRHACRTMDTFLELVERRRQLMEIGEMLAQVLNIEWSKDEIRFGVTLIDD
ncbi:heterokaryon incompatibility protein-domain-containing protein [Alternaria rosae]|uniref:heterokaryon incompatibility protein-domain-containing protein n=1 Tax=Alternaria rosae TaxID=1187941 RepID=UPI001E8E21C9|nr:heterokaryon incompatibility protein-domain-containing protein [Alternaria rosae]KAH6859136.1 heterokaryon incompatibility protein-domain-containing protein [Alternaria rosae]